MPNFREAKGTRLDWVLTSKENGFSNFSYTDKFFWSSSVLRRIFSIARKLNYQSLVVEEIKESDCALFEEESRALKTRASNFDRSKVRRILFLRSKVDEPVKNSDLLGYAVFKEDYFNNQQIPKCHVYESVFLPPRDESQNNYIHCSKEYTLKTTLGKLSVQGVLYAQQNDLTFVCAHVCIRTVLASILPNADISYTRINEITGINHTTNIVGDGNGLSPGQMEEILNAFDLKYSKIIHEPKDKNLELPGDYQHELYGAIESGQPALLGFELSGESGGRHIIPVIGHTFNEDTWVAPATRSYFDGDMSYYPSENWLSTYVVHDDNFGPYFCLPRHFLKKENFRLILSLKRYAYSIEPIDAEASAPELFSTTRRKFGEILIRSNFDIPKPLDWKLFLLARLPGEIVRITSSIEIDIRSSGTDSHVGLFEYTT